MDGAKKAVVRVEGRNEEANAGGAILMGRKVCGGKSVETGKYKGVGEGEKEVSERK